MNPWELFTKFQKDLCADQMRNPDVKEPTPEMINNVLLEMKEIFQEQDEDMAFYFGDANMPTDVPKEKSVPQDYQCEVDYDLAAEIEKAETNKGKILQFTKLECHLNQAVTASAVHTLHMILKKS